MEKKTSSRMLLEAGIIPKNAVAQLERNRMVPVGTTERHGIHPVSFEKDSEEARRFAEDLQCRLDEEHSEIRQTDLALEGEHKPVWIQWGDGSLDPNPQQCLVDKMGRVYIPIAMLGNGQRRKIKGVSFDGNKEGIVRVAYTEPRYEGEHLKTLACFLEERP